MVLYVYTRSRYFVLLSTVVPEIIISPDPQSLTMINNYSRFSSESVQIALLPMLLHSKYEKSTAIEISPNFNIGMDCFLT